MDYRRALSDYSSGIHDVFSLQKQSRKLLQLITKAFGCRWSCLMFHDAEDKSFSALFCQPQAENNPLSNLKLGEEHPVIKYLKRKGTLLTKDGFTTVPGYYDTREHEAEESKLNNIGLLMPLVSRDQLVGIIVLGRKRSGDYSLEDFGLLADVANQVAVSLDKEHLREQLDRYVEELSTISHFSATITSSLDIHEVFDDFVSELKELVDVYFAAVIMDGGDDLYCLGLSSDADSPWKVGQRLPKTGTATEWVITNKQHVIESDLSRESQFTESSLYSEQGIHSIVFLPLVHKDRAIGSLVLASRLPNAYDEGHIKLLDQLASQIAAPIENFRLYDEAKERARVDGLTGLFNRRSLDEMLGNEIGRHSRYGGVFSLIILDLDSFKAFNDNYGHLAGDDLLRKLGNLVKGSIRSADQAFRYGGDELVIILPNTSIGAAKQAAERIRKHIASEMVYGSSPVTASFGLAGWPADGKEADEIIAAADAALYLAKQTGGNRSCSAVDVR